MQIPEKCAKVNFHIKSEGDKSHLEQGSHNNKEQGRERRGLIRENLTVTVGQNTELLGDKEWRNGNSFTRKAR